MSARVFAAQIVAALAADPAPSRTAQPRTSESLDLVALLRRAGLDDREAGQLAAAGRARLNGQGHAEVLTVHGWVAPSPWAIADAFDRISTHGAQPEHEPATDAESAGLL